MDKEKPGANIIIIRRKKHAAHGHHGGAWKVAYADFVTAMMAFFLVMWLTSSSAAVKAAVAGYFREPGVFDYEHSNSMLAGGSGVAPEQKSGMDAGSLAAEQAALGKAAEHIKTELLTAPEVKSLRDQIEMTITAEGLRIELMDRAGSSFFDSGSSVLRGESIKILTVIAREVGKLNNDLVVEGHTDSRQYATATTFGNWELSADRANAARRAMEPIGLHAGQVRAVRGFADTQLRNPKDPMDPRNRRVSIVVRSHAAATLDSAVHAAAPAAGAAGAPAEKAPAEQAPAEKPAADKAPAKH